MRGTPLLLLLLLLLCTGMGAVVVAAFERRCMPLLLLQPLTCAKGECRTPTTAAALDSGCLPLMQSQCTGGEHPAVVALLLCHSQRGRMSLLPLLLLLLLPLPAQVQLHRG